MSNFSTILARMLAAAPANRDKRQGSPIYDTLAPTAAELAQMHITQDIFMEQTYLLTATGVNLENRAADYGITRSLATYAIRIAEMVDTDGNPIDLPHGSRFSTPNTAGGLNFALTAQFEAPGRCLVTCETAGTAGNAYLGAILPLFVINNLATATMTGTYIPAQDDETDDELRDRVLARINQKAYGGNVAQYKEWAGDIDGVGAVKVFPIWDGGGTVMLSIIDGEYNPATGEFIEVVQDTFDPIPHGGEGMGIAPIGHRVTVTTPTELGINISATVDLKFGYAITQLQGSIENAIAAYLAELRRQWADLDSMSIFIARISAAIISVQGINNVTNIMINGSGNDLELTQTPALQQLPLLESVVLANA